VRIRKTTPPTAAPIGFPDLLSGLIGCLEQGVVERREGEIRDWFGTEHVFFLSSGKAALFLILSALKETGNRRKVIIPAYTCFSVPSAIRKAGLEIVPCDILPESLDFDPGQLKGLCDQDTLCVVPTHLFGIPVDVSKVREIAGKEGAYVVEDAAQAMGVSRDGKKLGTIGDVGFFSFGRGKNVTCGSGGMIVTSSPEVAGKIRSLYDSLRPEPLGESAGMFLEIGFMGLFLSPSLYWLPRGLPFLKLGETEYHRDFPVFRMSRLKAGLLKDWKKKMERLNGIRKASAKRYVDTLGLKKGIGIYSEESPCLRFPVFLRDLRAKETVCESFGHLGVSPMYPSPVNRIREIQHHFGGSTVPSSEKIVRTLVTLPTHPLVSDSARNRLCSGIEGYLDPHYRNGEVSGERETEAGLRLRTEEWIRKFLNDPGDWNALNLLGRRFADQEKHYLARMCLLESLRLNPVQEEIFEGLQSSCDSPFPEYVPTGGTDENLISVIMGTWNRTDEIRESVQSVLDQTYPEYELLIINDGGPEEVEEIVRSFHSPKIRYFRMRENRGHASVLNEGVKRSAGRYIAYLDDDDVYYPNHLESLHKAIASSGKKFVYSNTKFVRGELREGKFVETKLMYRWNEEHDRDKLIRNNYIANLGVIHEKSVFTRVGLFSEDLNMVMDWDFWLRASLEFPFHHLDQTTSEYRFTGKNVTSNNRLWIDFYTNLVRNYHMYYKGMLSLATFHWEKGEMERASVPYQDIKSQYEEYFKAGDSYPHLADLAFRMNDYPFIDRIIVDYFRIDPRGCLKYVKGKKSARMYRGILPLVPGKIFKVVQNRLRSGCNR